MSSIAVVEVVVEDNAGDDNNDDNLVCQLRLSPSSPSSSLSSVTVGDDGGDGGDGDGHPPGMGGRNAAVGEGGGVLVVAAVGLRRQSSGMERVGEGR